MLGCLHPSLYKLLWCYTGFKKAKYMVVEMTSASGCLSLTISLTGQQKNQGRSKTWRGRRLEPGNPELQGLWVHSLRQAHSLHWANSFLCVAWILNLAPLDTEKEWAHGWREISILSFPCWSRRRVRGALPLSGRSTIGNMWCTEPQPPFPVPLHHRGEAGVEFRCKIKPEKKAEVEEKCF